MGRTQKERSQLAAGGSSGQGASSVCGLPRAAGGLVVGSPRCSRMA